MFTVGAAKAGKGSLEIEINGGSVPCTIQSDPNGQYHASFTPREAKPHTAQVQWSKEVKYAVFVVFVKFMLFLFQYCNLKQVTELFAPTDVLMFLL